MIGSQASLDDQKRRKDSSFIHPEFVVLGLGQSEAVRFHVKRPIVGRGQLKIPSVAHFQYIRVEPGRVVTYDFLEPLERHPG